MSLEVSQSNLLFVQISTEDDILLNLFQFVVGWSISTRNGQRNYCTRKVFSDSGRSPSQ